MDNPITFVPFLDGSIRRPEVFETRRSCSAFERFGV